MMTLTKFRGCSIALLAMATMVITAEDSFAWSYGSTYASYGSYGSGGSYASAGGYGSRGRMGLFARWHARKAARKAARASYGSYGSYGSAGSYGTTVAYHAGYGSHGGYGSGGSYGAVYSAPAYSAPVDTGCVDCYGESSTTTDSTMLASGSAAIEVSLPVDAKVYVNNSLTTSTGSTRNYVSNGLEQGRTYAYQLRVEYNDAGETQVEERRLRLTAGDKLALSFGKEDSRQLAADQEPVRTELKLNVPEDAEVYLAGSPTTQMGSSRTYVTTQLKSGQQWDNYTVRVEWAQDGKQLVKEQALSVVAGQSYEMAFEFEEVQDSVQVAQLN